MNPREIEVHIDELVLHGFAQGDRWNVGDALESELRGLLIRQGFPAAWQADPGKLDAGTIRLTNSAAETGNKSPAWFIEEEIDDFSNPNHAEAVRRTERGP